MDWIENEESFDFDPQSVILYNALLYSVLFCSALYENMYIKLTFSVKKFFLTQQFACHVVVSQPSNETLGLRHT